MLIEYNNIHIMLLQYSYIHTYNSNVFVAEFQNWPDASKETIQSNLTRASALKTY